MTVEGIKKRLELFNQYDQAMAGLVKEMDDFYKNSKTLVRQESEVIKLYGLAFNFAWTLRNSIELCQKYEHEVKNSLLHERFDINKKISDDFEQYVDEIVPQLEKLSQTLNICIDNNQRVEVITADDSDAEKLLSDNEYLSELSKDLAANGNKILNIACFYLRHISKQLINIKTVRANLTDNDYRFLYEKEMKEYLATEEWHDMKVGYIENVINIKFKGVEPNIEDLDNLYMMEYENIASLSDDLGCVEAYLNDLAKLGHHLVMRQVLSTINNPIITLFHHFGKMLLIKEWIKAKEEEDLCFKPDEGEPDVWEYSFNFSEERCKAIWPQIKALFENRKVTDWVCLYHVLVYYNYVTCDDFNVFTRWLKKINNEVDIIKESHSRVIKMSYWAINAKRKWDKQELLKKRNSKQAENQFEDYIQLCKTIRIIIREG